MNSREVIFESHRKSRDKKKHRQETSVLATRNAIFATIFAIFATLMRLNYSPSMAILVSSSSNCSPRIQYCSGTPLVRHSEISFVKL